MSVWPEGKAAVPAPSPARDIAAELREGVVAAAEAELWERIVLSLIAGKCYTDDDINIDNLRKDAVDVLTVIKAGPPRSEP